MKRKYKVYTGYTISQKVIEKFNNYCDERRLKRSGVIEDIITKWLKEEANIQVKDD